MSIGGTWRRCLSSLGGSVKSAHRGRLSRLLGNASDLNCSTAQFSISMSCRSFGEFGGNALREIAGRCVISFSGIEIPSIELILCKNSSLSFARLNGEKFICLNCHSRRPYVNSLNGQNVAPFSVKTTDIDPSFSPLPKARLPPLDFIHSTNCRAVWTSVGRRAFRSSKIDVSSDFLPKPLVALFFCAASSVRPTMAGTIVLRP